MRKIVFTVLNMVWMGFCQIYATPNPNQTPDVSPILSSDLLPFEVKIELADFSLPSGIHSYAVGTHNGKWLFICGRTNGLHGFHTNQFPPDKQNTVVYVVDPIKKTVASRSLEDSKSGLSSKQIELLSVTSPEYYQNGNMLYVIGGYGVDSEGNFSTKPYLSAIDMPSLIKWVTHPSSKQKASSSIRHLFHPIFQVTGGYATQIGNSPVLLIFGQNFEGVYMPNRNGDYTEQVRRFVLYDNGDKLAVFVMDPLPSTPNGNYRRRDLNVLPMMKKGRSGLLSPTVTAFSGVFTEAEGIWTVPVEINAHGHAKMADPSSPTTFKQGMNNYVCPAFGLYSAHHDRMYNIFLGGISYEYFSNGQLVQDDAFPFINQVTTILRDRTGIYTQYLMDAEYPVLYAPGDPNNPLLFGAGGGFIENDELHSYFNGVLKLDKIHEPVIAGYIVGGIQSLFPNTTNSGTQTAASPYIFKVILSPK